MIPWLYCSFFRSEDHSAVGYWLSELCFWHIHGLNIVFFIIYVIIFPLASHSNLRYKDVQKLEKSFPKFLGRKPAIELNLTEKEPELIFWTNNTVKWTWHPNPKGQDFGVWVTSSLKLRMSLAIPKFHNEYLRFLSCEEILLG